MAFSVEIEYEKMRILLFGLTSTADRGLCPIKNGSISGESIHRMAVMLYTIYALDQG